MGSRIWLLGAVGLAVVTTGLLLQRAEAASGCPGSAELASLAPCSGGPGTALKVTMSDPNTRPTKLQFIYSGQGYSSTVEAVPGSDLTKWTVPKNVCPSQNHWTVNLSYLRGRNVAPGRTLYDGPFTASLGTFSVICLSARTASPEPSHPAVVPPSSAPSPATTTLGALTVPVAKCPPPADFHPGYFTFRAILLTCTASVGGTVEFWMNGPAKTVRFSKPNHMSVNVPKTYNTALMVSANLVSADPKFGDRGIGTYAFTVPKGLCGPVVPTAYVSSTIGAEAIVGSLTVTDC